MRVPPNRPRWLAVNWFWADFMRPETMMTKLTTVAVTVRPMVVEISSSTIVKARRPRRGRMGRLVPVSEFMDDRLDALFVLAVPENPAHADDDASRLPARLGVVGDGDDTFAVEDPACR